jgi:integrase
VKNDREPRPHARLPSQQRREEKFEGVGALAAAPFGRPGEAGFSIGNVGLPQSAPRRRGGFTPTRPVVRTPEEVARLIEAAPGPKYKAALGAAYGVGLRVSEVANLRVSDIDSERMVMRVEQGKSKKHRGHLNRPARGHAVTRHLVSRMPSCSSTQAKGGVLAVA